MMKSFVAWWAKNPVAGNLLMIACFILGLLAYLRMEKEFFPPGRDNGVFIQASWPGASPEDMEEQITVRLEEVTNGLDGVNWVRSQAGEGYTWVRVSANPGVDVDALTNEVKSRVDAISGLPSGIEPPRVSRQVGRNFAMLIAVNGDVEEKVLRETAKTLRDRISVLDGGANVYLVGARQPEISIELSEESLRRYGLTFGEVSQAVRVNSLDASSGTVRTDNGTFQLAARNQAEDALSYGNIILRETAEGAIVRLRDVAKIQDGFQDVDLYNRVDGKPSVMVFLDTADQFNIQKTSGLVQKEIESFKAQVPEGINIDVILNQNEDYNSLTGILFSNALQGFFLIFILLVLTLHPKVAVWATLGVMTAFAGSFILLPIMDVSLNFMSVFGFLLVLGIMVDDAIIVGESVYERVERTGKPGVENSILATQLILKPLIASVLVTMLAFMPWMLIQSEMRQFTRAISIVVMSSLLFSLIESLIILPAHLAHVSVPKKSNSFFGKLMQLQQKCAHAVLWFADNVHRPLLIFAVRWRYATLALFLGLFLLVTTLTSTGRVKSTFMPEVEGDFIFASVDLPQSTPFNRLQEIAAQLETVRDAFEKETKEFTYIDPNTSKESRGAIRSWSTVIEGTSVRAYIGLTPPELRELKTSEATKRMKELLGPVPDAERINFDFSGGGGGGRIEIALIGEDQDELRAAVEDLKAKLNSYDDVISVRDSEEAAIEEVRLSLKPGAERLGLSLASLSQQVRQAYFGDEAQRIARDGDDVRVYVRYPREERRSLESLSAFRIRTPDGREIPLSEVARISFEPGITSIDRRQRKRSIAVEAEAPAEARTEIMRSLNEEYFPGFDKNYTKVSRRAIGEQEAMQEFFEELGPLFAFSIFGMYMLLAVVFKSYTKPLLILSAIPFAYMGAVVGHYILGVSFGLFSILGAIAAMGVVVNDNVVLIDRMNIEREEGKTPYQAVIDATVMRFRQIFLTSVTEFVGLSPMLFERAAIAQFLKPMALSLAFGVLICMPVTLILVPCLAVIGQDVSRFFGWAWNGAHREPRAQPAE